MSKFEKKFGKYAIPNLTLILIMCYVAGYVIEMMGRASNTYLLGFLTLDPYRILHGQIWRLVTWVIGTSGKSGHFHDHYVVFLLQSWYYAGAHLGDLPL